MTYEATKLEPCPFCGSDAAKITEDHGTYEPGCTHCGTCIGQYSSERSAAAAWNRRALPPQAKAEPAGVSEREAFEDFFGRSLDFSRTNTWSGIEYVHPHVESIWYGWQARAILSAAPSTGVREDAAGVAPSGEASSWWALVMGAAASIEDAANCLRDPDAKKQADGAAKHYREAAQKLWGSRGVAIPDAWLYTRVEDGEKVLAFEPTPGSVGTWEPLFKGASGVAEAPEARRARLAKACGEVFGWEKPAGVDGPSAPVAEYKPCPDCSGSGIVDNTEHFEDCKPCNGTGNVGVDGPLKENDNG